jgi:hypothetical protein
MGLSAGSADELDVAAKQVVGKLMRIFLCGSCPLRKEAHHVTIRRAASEPC